ncbi:cellulase family glycosylhydrolase [Echinicola sp. CAU 1574]|uniref:Cellulase family glycosylhydrolase n=1 Tax=Echinicola arenosa TaxID=2774144 RepID=A0ABR9AF11_9BACT|nr:endo-1,4-beta-xylanase [Echinicola arenosa]MBD8487286.1 cellulase family glycosylhydrolase [Echinicola arenosa]
MGKKYLKILNCLGLVAIAISCGPKGGAEEKQSVPDVNETAETSERWSKEQAKAWYAEQDWLVGANFNPSNSINQLEMWQKETFSPELIDTELGWAEDIGMNTMRVYLHDLAYQQDPDGFLERMDSMLGLMDKHGMKPLFVFFDSCWDPFVEAGKQRAPKPHVHNSGWVQSPGYHALADSTQYPRLENYVKAVVGRFANDPRVLGWDIWNEPDNDTGVSYRDKEHPNKVDYVLPLMEEAFDWARSQHPIQPLTSGVWLGDWASEDVMSPIQLAQINNSDIISFHNYDSPEEFQKRIDWLKRYDRPMICTEYMARPNGSTFEGFLPIAKAENIGMFNWGLVDGKTQTKYPWDSWEKEYTAEPELWFHEVFHKDGTPYKKSETNLIKSLTGR